MTQPGIKVYYDGLCHLCSREIDHYRTQRGSESIEFVDITAPGFDPGSEGLDPIRVHQAMHVRRADGTLAVGVDAFITLWEWMPRYRLAARLSRGPGPRFFLRLGYRVFAAARPYLPKRRRDCAQSPYCGLPDGKDG
jgi:predicted DCC family thiol-disulfide oxidoreductase YuxK